MSDAAFYRPAHRPSAPQWARDPSMVHVYHPEEKFMIILSLPAFDHHGAGIHFGTLWEGCRIVTGNTDGYLSTSEKRDPAATFHPDRTGHDDILPVRKYFYHATDFTKRRYDLCRRFESWTLPENGVPAAWTSVETREPHWPDYCGDIPNARSEVSSTVRIQDKRCCLSGQAANVQAAHIVPHADPTREWVEARSEVAEAVLRWTEDRASDLPNFGDSSIVDRPPNLVSLRPDLHVSFDKYVWVMVPKRGSFYANFIQRIYFDACADFHGTELLLAARIAAIYLYIRFALAMIHCIPSVRKLSPTEGRGAASPPALLIMASQMLAALLDQQILAPAATPTQTLGKNLLVTPLGRWILMLACKAATP